MCWGDMQIARATTVRSINSARNVSGGVAISFDQYLRRQAIIITVESTSILAAEPAVLVFRGGDASNDAAILLCQDYRNPLIIDRRQWGAVLQEQLTISIDFVDATGDYSIVELELSDPLGHGNPLTQTPKG